MSGEELEGVADDDRLVEAARQVDVVGI